MSEMDNSEIRSVWARLPFGASGFSKRRSRIAEASKWIRQITRSHSSATELKNATKQSWRRVEGFNSAIPHCSRENILALTEAHKYMNLWNTERRECQFWSTQNLRISCFPQAFIKRVLSFFFFLLPSPNMQKNEVTLHELFTNSSRTLHELRRKTG